MNTTIILTMTFCLVCIVPFVIMNRNNKKAEKAILEKLLGLAASNHERVAQYNLLDNLAIGLSETKNTVFFVNSNNEQHVMEIVNLNEVEKCDLNRPLRRSLDGKDSTIERIELIFTFRDRQIPVKKFQFYDIESQSLTLRGELQLAEKWHLEIINKLRSLKHERS